MKKKIIGFAVLFSIVIIGAGLIQNVVAVNDTVAPADTIAVAADSTIVEADTAKVAENNASHLSILTEYKGKFNIKAIGKGLLGLLSLILIGWLFSANRKAINWRTVLFALGLQIFIAVLVVYAPPVQAAIQFIGDAFVKVLGYTEMGSGFIFGGLIDQHSYGFIFAFQVLPTIVFFSALSSLLYYLRVIQFFVFIFAWVMTKFLRLSGAESLSAAGNIFLGQTESPLLIKAYLDRMTKSEILLVMVGGMATIAGGVLAIYIKQLGGGDPDMERVFAQHLITASVMAAPGAVVMAKLLLPQTEKIDTNISIPKDKIGSNVLQSLAIGTTEGVKLAVNVAAMLLVFLAMIYLFNGILGKIGDWTSLNPIIDNITNGRYEQLSLQFILGYTMAPLMYLIGVNPHDITTVGQLLGEKIILNELVAYKSLSDVINSGVLQNPKSIIISTYILCGFANFGSIGIQLGGIGAIAPSKKKLLSQLGFRALLGGALASLLSATIVGMIYG